MRLPLIALTLIISLFGGVLALADEADSTSELARLAAQIEVKHGALNIALDEGADIALIGSLDVLEYDLDRIISDEEREMVRKVYREALATILTPEVWVEASAEVYARHLSTDELKDLTDFYQTESGARILAAQGSISVDLGAAAETLLDANQQAFADLVDAALSELFPDYADEEIE